MVTSVLKYLWRRFKSLEGDIKVAISVAEGEGRRVASLKKQCQSAEESRLNLKSRDEAEGGLVQKLALGGAL